MRQPLDRTHKGYFEFRDLADAGDAKANRLPPYDGKFHLLKDAGGREHCGYWTGQRFAYSSGATIDPPVTAYCARTIGDEPLREAARG